MNALYVPPESQPVQYCVYILDFLLWSLWNTAFSSGACILGRGCRGESREKGKGWKTDRKKVSQRPL